MAGIIVFAVGCIENEVYQNLKIGGGHTTFLIIYYMQLCF